ncbi:MAG: hypothetical protein EZS28_034130 [Streblomastix strix]|uniref:Uncharacterized protein n=1 Tax=Streblomastix strix TaxID=222440 RepID=A0A5J4UJD9_9EUKA|nr:MAG: hypothetical protein EZS28_034130 [Streblomastix strix]
MHNSNDKRCKDCSRIAEAKRIFSRVNGVEFRDNYQGFDFVGDIDNFINKEQINVRMITYESDPSHYELTQNYLVSDSDKQFNIVFINDGINAHIMYISDVEALTGFRYCNICHKYYITYDIETLEKKVNEKFGDSSQVTATLIPYAIASTVKLASDIHSFYYDIRTEDFLDKWLKQVFEDAKQVKKENKYIDETIQKYYEIPVIEFNSAKFDTSILLKNLKQKDWTISNEDKYKDYLVEADKHKSRWDYLKHYNILDTRVLTEPIDYLIELMFKYKVDMLANISMSQCSNAIKYSTGIQWF